MYMCAQVNLPSTSTAVGFVSFFGGSRQLSNIFLTCLLGFPTVRLPRVFVTTVRHLVWFIEEPNIDDQGLEKETKFFHQKFAPCKFLIYAPNIMGFGKNPGWHVAVLGIHVN